MLSRVKRHVQSVTNDLRMFRLVRENNYDFIQVKDKFISAILAILVARISRIRFIYWLSYPFPEAEIYQARTGSTKYPLVYLARGILFKFLLYRMIMPMADHIFVQSEQMKKDVVNQGVAKEKVTAIPMGVSPEIFAQGGVNGDLPHTSKEKSVIYLGTMIRVRRIDFVIRVFAKVLQKVPDAVLYMVGDGEDPEDIEIIKNEVKRLGINGNVRFTGNLPRREALSYVSRADVCVSPFYPTPILNSTSPTKLIEYMAMGKPVVANDHPEQSLVISESGGGICVSYSEELFAEAIVELLDQPEVAARMGARGRRYVEQSRTYVRIAQMVEEQYHKVCRGKKGTETA